VIGARARWELKTPALRPLDMAGGGKLSLHDCAAEHPQVWDRHLPMPHHNALESVYRLGSFRRGAGLSLFLVEGPRVW
jgi:hypothetical protein